MASTLFWVLHTLCFYIAYNKLDFNFKIFRSTTICMGWVIYMFQRWSFGILFQIFFVTEKLNTMVNRDDQPMNPLARMIRYSLCSFCVVYEWIPEFRSWLMLLCVISNLGRYRWWFVWEYPNMDIFYNSGWGDLAIFTSTWFFNKWKCFTLQTSEYIWAGSGCCSAWFVGFCNYLKVYAVFSLVFFS